MVLLSAKEIDFDLVISCIALVVSSMLVIYEIFCNKKLNKKNLESGLYNEIFKKYLIEVLPKSIAELSYRDNKVINVDKFQDDLNNFRTEVKLFEYIDKKFYFRLKKEIQTLEDYSILKSSVHAEEYGDYMKNIREKMSNIYKIVLDKYSK